ncbi:energy-coupling factor ABC transporter ATP-binding protein [Labedella populi]|uniref:Energy-coupling factor ABC transporter ATP-binding protein n=1 Tax=Labedella populi TaxID=2498850 RepID=A0A444Q6P2_9MICO|nr:ABC transporter ATP-binding protein [Labedella populi]RWZ59573.1 energy-coupling factor ABC transporter ATP-binding protein [Labedella populi]
MSEENPATTRPAIEVDALRIRHHGRETWTPDGVSFSVRAGEVMLVLGPSGSGKSTLTLALDGLVPHVVAADVEGSVRVGGLDTASHSVARMSEHVAIVFQDPDAQIVTGSVLDEVCFAPENQLLPIDVVLARAEAALRRVGLWERRDEDPAVLSGGGRQRLAIAAALAAGGEVIVLDEPTANLDAAGAEDVYDSLREVVADGSRSVVLVEHDLDAAVTLVDRVVVLDRRGALVLDGPVDVVLREHAVELERLGVWLPTATTAAVRLSRAGVPFERLPLTPAELAVALDAVAELPAPLAPVVVPTPADAAVTTDTTAVSVRGLTVFRGRGRGRVPVLRDVDLSIRSGAFTAVVGVNGAGKTTLLQAIAGVVRPPRGTVSLAGLDPAAARAAALSRHVGFVFQNPEHQFMTHTVRDELAYGPRATGREPAQIDAQVDELLDRFGLAEAADVNPFLLSGGQKRRLSVGTALIGGAGVLVLDEPTFGQDRERADELVDLLATLQATGTTVIVATHDLQLVAETATSVVVLADGRVIAHAPPDAVFEDDDLLVRAGLRRPALSRAMRLLERHPDWRGITALSRLPGPPR